MSCIYVLPVLDVATIIAYADGPDVVVIAKQPDDV